MIRSDCSVSYDKSNKRLVYRGSAADESHWDAQWASRLTAKAVQRADPFVCAQTRKCLSTGAKVLDAGCGLSHTVWGLHHAGFDAFGVDYAAETVRIVNRLAPELNVRKADVRDLPFPDSFFDGVWSLGVIEHFPEGFSRITREMWRVLRPGGYAFVTAPSISPLRRMKTRLGLYPPFDGNMAQFYQFVLTPDDIINRFELEGWIYEGGKARGGFLGLSDETGLLMPMVQAVYDNKSSIVRYFRAAANRILAPVSFHTRFYRFQKPIGTNAKVTIDALCQRSA